MHTLVCTANPAWEFGNYASTCSPCTSGRLCFALYYSNISVRTCSNILILSMVLLSVVLAHNEEERLQKNLMNNYNRNLRPAKKDGDIISVSIKLTLTNLITLVCFSFVYISGIRPTIMLISFNLALHSAA